MGFAEREEATQGVGEAGPRSIHGYFLVSHERVRKLADCVRQHCTGQARDAALQEAEQALKDLGVAIEAFTHASTDAIDEHASTS